MNVFAKDKLSIKEAADLVGKSVQTIRRWRNQGLKCCRIPDREGGHWYTTKTDLQNYVLGNDDETTETV